MRFLALILAWAAVLGEPAGRSIDMPSQACNKVHACLDRTLKYNRNAGVLLVFEGHMMMKFGACQDPCRVGFPIDGTPHDLKITVVTVTPAGRTQRVIYDRMSLSDDLWVRADKPAPGGIHRYGDPRFDRKTSTDLNDFGWGVDLEGCELHAKVLPWDPNRKIPSIYVADGVFFTFNRNPNDFQLYQNGNNRGEFGHLAQTIAAGIDLEDGGKVTLQFASDNKVLTKLQPDAGKQRYEVYIMNQAKNRRNSDFLEYYAELQVPANIVHYSLVRRPRIPARGHGARRKGSINVPCMIAGFGGN